MKYSGYIGKAPVGVEMTSMPSAPICIFEINEENAVSAYYDGDGVYSGFRTTKVHDGYIVRGNRKHFLDDIVRVGTPWMPDAPECRKVIT